MNIIFLKQGKLCVWFNNPEHLDISHSNRRQRRRGESDLVIRKNSRMEGGCLNEHTNWRLKLENPSNQCEVEKAYIGGMTEMTLMASSSQAAYTQASLLGCHSLRIYFSICLFFAGRKGREKRSIWFGNVQIPH